LASSKDWQEGVGPAATRGALGTVIELWRYPVKSMQGEPLQEALADERGIVGDRAYVVIECESGAVASAKHPRKWAALLGCQASFAEPPQARGPLPPVMITLPDGAQVSSVGGEADRALSALLGREVRLSSEPSPGLLRDADRTPIDSQSGERLIRREPLALGAPAGTFFDYGPLHLLTTATLAHLQALYPEGRFSPRRFRPNLLIATDQRLAGLLEHEWLGKTLAVGGHPGLRVFDPTPRCVVTTLAQAGLPRDPGILRAATRHSSAPSVTVAPGVVFDAVVGVYASAVAAGPLRLGDAVSLGA
jgi:uncharacterized protein YcbX